MMRDREVIRVLETLSEKATRYEKEAIKQAIDSVNLIKIIRRTLKGK